MTTIAAHNLYIWAWQNRDYLNVGIDKQPNDIKYIWFKDKNNCFIIKMSMYQDCMDNIKKSNKSETQAIWDEFEKIANDSTLRIIGKKK